LAWIIIAAVAVVGELVLRAGSAEPLVEFTAPVKPLPAYHVISATDVRQLWRPRDLVPDGAPRDAAMVVGHVTLRRLSPDHPISPTDIGPRAGAGMQGDLTVVGVPATPAMTLIERLRAGDRVNVLTSSSTTDTPMTVLDVRRVDQESEPFVVIIAVPPGSPVSVVRDLAMGQASLIRIQSS
jgi:hypothetical protein